MAQTCDRGAATVISPVMRRELGDVRSIRTATSSHESAAGFVLLSLSLSLSTLSLPPYHQTGNAVVVREASAPEGGTALPRVEYRGEFLHAFMTTERVTSHKPVVLTRGKDRFSADSLDYDNVEQVIQMRGRVRGTLDPSTR